MKKESQKARGARDLLPEDMKNFRHIENIFRKSCNEWGYEEVRTPTLEYLHLFTSAGTLTPAMLNKVYSFLDWDGWSGERVVLRPDGTIPVARLYTENLSKQKIAKLCYVTNVFSFESTGKENREKWQFGVEYLGRDGFSADVETISLAMEILKELKINDVTIKLSHAGLIKAILKSLNLDEERYQKILEQVNHGNWQYLTKLKGIDSDTSNLLSVILNIKGKSSGFLENIQSLPGISNDLKSAINNFAGIAALLDVLDYNYQIDITSTRNFEYYTGLCFQIIYRDLTIVSGGRYNSLLPLMGMDNVPACGFALYADHLMKFLVEIKPEDKNNSIAIICSGQAVNVLKAVFDIAEHLHSKGFTAEIQNSKNLNEYRWIIEYKSKASVFLVTDNVKNKTVELNSTATLIKMLKSTKLTG